MDLLLDADQDFFAGEGQDVYHGDVILGFHLNLRPRRCRGQAVGEIEWFDVHLLLHARATSRRKARRQHGDGMGLLGEFIAANNFEAERFRRRAPIDIEGKFGIFFKNVLATAILGRLELVVRFGAVGGIDSE